MKALLGFSALMMLPFVVQALPTAMDVAMLPIELRTTGVLTEQVSCQGLSSRRTHDNEGVMIAESADQSWRTEHHRESWKDGETTFSFTKGRVGDATGWIRETQSFRRSTRVAEGAGLIIETTDVRVYSRLLSGVVGESGPSFEQDDSVIVNTYLLMDGSEVLVRSVVDDREVIVASIEQSVRPFQGGRTESRTLRAPYWSSFQQLHPVTHLSEMVYVLTSKDESSCTYTVLR